MTRVSFVYRHIAVNSGWSDTYWNTHNTLSDVKTAATDLRGKLMALVGRQTFIERIRYTRIADPFSDPPVSRATELDRYLFTPTADQPLPNPGGVDVSDFPTTCLVIPHEAPFGDGRRAFHFLNGIPDNQVNLDGEYRPSSAYKRRVEELIALLHKTAEGWRLRSQDQSATKFGVRTLVKATGVLTTSVAHTFVRGDLVQLQGFPAGARYANRKWRVGDAPTATTIVLKGWDPPASFPDVDWMGTTTARRVRYVLAEIDHFGAIFAGERKVGRPTKRLTGRRTIRK